MIAQINYFCNKNLTFKVWLLPEVGVQGHSHRVHRGQSLLVLNPHGHQQTQSHGQEIRKNQLKR